MTKESIRQKEKEKSMDRPAIEKLPNLKKRQRSVYYRPDGQGGWMETQLLPSDAQGRELYLSKGFRLTPPSPLSDVATSDTEKEGLYAEISKLKQELAEKPKRKKSLSGTL